MNVKDNSHNQQRRLKYIFNRMRQSGTGHNGRPQVTVFASCQPVNTTQSPIHCSLAHNNCSLFINNNNIICEIP
ncbi:hypothetical protein BFJ63_vAg12809 [Fusarium oxysporum f. sp. narcissi]|uniref:Uncharacterized protein n=1 Tax=Fusarium oxysporum f. sp. narcissi TaxID=451672 RepID=A0A4Q2VHA5_FUSOX|nr:hypothetical protein BFJ66_g1833 [Fusarium oxysporum f. sp. cepae]RYC84273.1 hypothetical protein BFJ63_vAg12809 [Fusarium oxysporum f. sp. narcissi]